MMCGKCRLAGVLITVSMLVCIARGGEETKPGDSSVFGVFVGSSPCTESISPVLQIPADANLQIRWNLTLYQNPKTREPAGYQLRCDYESTVAGAPKPENRKHTVKRKGLWTIGKGTKWNEDAVVYELSGAVVLFQLNRDILHVLNPDRSLMVGNGGWSYTLNRAESAEKLGTPAPPPDAPPESYKILPLEKGPAVFGIFAGRTPYEGIVRHLNQDANARGTKLKWVVTLFQDPATLAPTTYRLEGTFFRSNVRVGKWTIMHGTATDPNAMVYQLEPTKTQSGLSLLKGDENVLFFLDGNGKPFVGHANFSYTLNREKASP
jgi:hypothetical protein